ncbi:MAG: glycosyltransferase family 4 protein [Candidatus Paceibacterota bacterium]
MQTDGQKPKRLLSIGTDRLLFEPDSAVSKRFLEYGKQWDEIHVIVATDRSFRETSIGSNVWVYPTRSAAKILYPMDAMRLGRFIIARRDITKITCQDPFLTAMAGVSLRKGSGLPLELQVHTDIGSPNYPYSLGNKLRKAMALSHLPKADSIRVVSDRISQYVIETLGISPAKIFVRPIAVDVEALKNAPITADLRKKYPQFGKVVLMASRLEPEKGVELAIRSWPEVIKDIPKAGLIIVGSGSQAGKLKALVAHLGLDHSIVFESWADQGTLASYYKTSDLFLNTSLFEGYGMTLVEAHAAGCRIVSTDVGVAGEQGAMIVEQSPVAVARGITDALRV